MLEQAERSKVVDEGEGICIEIKNLDTITYTHNLCKLDIFYDRLKKEDGQYELYMDLEGVTTWNMPRHEKISHKEAALMQKHLLEALHILGLKGELYWPNHQT